jgi:hypothetical protein
MWDRADRVVTIFRRPIGVPLALKGGSRSPTAKHHLDTTKGQSVAPGTAAMAVRVALVDLPRLAVPESRSVGQWPELVRPESA